MSYCIQCGAAARMAVPEGDSRPRLVCDVCAYIHYENPKLVTGVLAVHDDKILLCRRAIEPKLGYWTLPAGFMELGETMQAGALREMVEEAESQAINARLYCLMVVRVEACAAVKLPLALVASIALRAVSCPVFLGMF